MNGMERPDTADLLAIAHATLQAEVIPQLQGDARFKALMVANAMAIALRALAAAPIDDMPEQDALCAAIRTGLHDADADLAARLLHLAEQRCRISAPKAL